MQIVQKVMQKLLAAAVAAAGVYIMGQALGYWSDRMPLAVPESRIGAIAVGLVFVFAGLIAVLPPLRFRRKSPTIAFPGEHGDVLIHLDSVQANLNKVVAKRPEVKRSYVKVIPVSDKRRVRLEADVLLIKTPDGGAREIAEKLRKFIATTAANMLGIDEITTVDLNVRGIVVDRGVVKAMATSEADAQPAKTVPGTIRAEKPIPADSVPTDRAKPAAATGVVSHEAPAAASSPRPVALEPDTASNVDDLAPLPSWDEPAAPAQDDAITGTDIVTPLLEATNGPANDPGTAAPEKVEEPRDSDLFP